MGLWTGDPSGGSGTPTFARMTAPASEAVFYAEHNQFYVVDADMSAADDDEGDFDRAASSSGPGAPPSGES